MKNPYYMPRVRSKIQERIWAQLEDADVEIAYPHRHHVFDETSGTASVAVEDDNRPSAERGRREPPAEEFDSRE